MDDVRRVELNWTSMRQMDDVERVARALCAYDRINPDKPVISGKTEPVMEPDGVVVARPASEPAWKDYVVEARRFIVAMEALCGRSFARVD